MGNTDVEDALQRLDRLTQEEARMASAELLRISHNVEDRVIHVDEGVQGVDRGVKDVGDKVEGVDGKVQDVSDGLQEVRMTVQGVDDKVVQANREPSPNRLPLLFNYVTFSQGIISENAFELGSLLQIHLLITTLHATLNMKEQHNGSFVAQFSISGNPLALSCGYMENVGSSSLSPYHLFLTIHLQPRSRLGKEYNLVRPSQSLSLSTPRGLHRNVVPQS
jgi:hypothetical protein